MIKQEKIEQYKSRMQQVKNERDLKPNTITVFNAVLDFFKDLTLPNTAYDRHYLEVLGETTGFTNKTIMKHLDILEDIGIITLHKRRGLGLLMKFKLPHGYEYLKELEFKPVFKGKVEIPNFGYNAEHRLVWVNTGTPSIFCEDTGICLFFDLEEK
ncbi:hypothetical protein RJP03_003525 [Vibrio cholerae]